MNAKFRYIIGRVPLAVDMGMIIALLSLSYWVGQMANRIEAQGISVIQIRAQVDALPVMNNTAQIAALKERSNAQQEKIAELREYLSGRLDRIERKIDNR